MGPVANRYFSGQVDGDLQSRYVPSAEIIYKLFESASDAVGTEFHEQTLVYSSAKGLKKVCVETDSRTSRPCTLLAVPGR
ncbi:hypothetical protein CRM22_011424 [Opisthorchis felineus]|uniref:Uncharacterized protein n=1 Tax=Opisthorchis felineus TaxID=147828 RepID=A0A4S2JC96_OPIFE|nr:hypothetical protein CRM22_011424 [Opisthorchis felineus]